MRNAWAKQVLWHRGNKKQHKRLKELKRMLRTLEQLSLNKDEKDIHKKGC